MKLHLTPTETLALLYIDPSFASVEDTRQPHGIALFGVCPERDRLANRVQAHLESHWPNVPVALLTAAQKLFGTADASLVTHPPTGQVLKPWLIA